MLIALVTLAFSIQSAYSIDDANLIGAWLFEGSGDDIIDSSGNGLDGIIAQGAPKRANGKFGKAMEFFGSDMITVADNDLLDLGNFTLSAWINVDGQSGKWQIIASKENRNPTGRNYGMFCNINSGVIHYSFTANAAWQSFDASTVVTDNSWHHVAAVYENPDFKLYLDGAVDAQVSPGAEPDTSDNVFFIGGCDIGDYWMTGLIDEVALFSEALSEDDINALMGGLESVVLAVQPLQKLTTTWGSIK
jgi:hypothetical protein